MKWKLLLQEGMTVEFPGWAIVGMPQGVLAAGSGVFPEKVIPDMKDISIQ